MNLLGRNCEEKFEKGENVFCINESVYKENLTKRKKYRISEVGTGAKFGKVRIKGDLNRLVWISNLHFSKFNQAKIENIKIDDEIDDSKSDCVELTITFDNGKRAWFNAITPKYVRNTLLRDGSFFIGKNFVFVNEISQEKIVKVVEELDRSNQLLDLLIPYD